MSSNQNQKLWLFHLPSSLLPSALPPPPPNHWLLEEISAVVGLFALRSIRILIQTLVSMHDVNFRVMLDSDPRNTTPDQPSG